MRFLGLVLTRLPVCIRVIPKYIVLWSLGSYSESQTNKQTNKQEYLGKEKLIKEFVPVNSRSYYKHNKMHKIFSLQFCNKNKDLFGWILCVDVMEILKISHSGTELQKQNLDLNAGACQLLTNPKIPIQGNWNCVGECSFNNPEDLKGDCIATLKNRLSWKA